MYAEEYLKMKEQNLLQKYGKISEPLYARIKQEAFEKFEAEPTHEPKPGSLDALIAEKKQLCELQASELFLDPSLECVLDSSELLYENEEDIPDLTDTYIDFR